MIKLLGKGKVQMFLALLSIVVFAIAGNFSPEIIFRYLIIVGFILVLEYILWKARKVKPFLPSASFVTGTIIFLLSDTDKLIVFPLIAVIFAVLQKQLIRPNNTHIFNPAAFGLFISAYLGNVISWWGPNTNIITVLLSVMAVGYVSSIKVRQWKITLPFLATTFLILFFRSGISAAIGEFTIGSFLFFSFVMLPEPMSAPQSNWAKPFYGILIAILPFIALRIPNVSDLQLASLLTGNLVFKILERFKS